MFTGVYVYMGAQLSSHIQKLEDSFTSFNQLSHSLEHTYLDLERRVSQLHLQLTDINGKRETEKLERIKLDSRLRHILKALPAGVIVLDPNGVIVESNPAAEDYLGIPLDEQRWCDVALRAFSPKSDDGHEISLHDGRRISLSTCPLGDDPGQIILLTDVSETRELQEKLNQFQRLTAMGEMVAGLAHQIRTPLATGLLLASQIKNTKCDAHKRVELVDKVMSHMRHLEGLVGDMLMFSRSEHGGNELIDVADFITSIQNDIELQPLNVDINFTVKNHITNAAFVGNRSILLSAIQNIIINALQAAGKSGEVNVFTKSDYYSSIDICVQDNGPGIPGDVKDKIFEPFFTTRTQGTGLGLSIVQSVIRAHKGEVWLDASGNKGSTFIVRLPAKYDDSLIKEAI